MLVLFVVFCFAPFSSSADDGGAARNVTGTVQAARKAVSSVIGDVEPAPVLGSGYDAHFFMVLHFFLGDFNKRANLHRSATA